MVRYQSETTTYFAIDERRSYPNFRSDFRPPAYVVLTREIEAKSEERCG